jgi:membrane dipeptidase
LKVAGEEAVCLGSDFDGLVPLPSGMRDVTDLWKLMPGIERTLGLNLRRFLSEILRNLERRSAGRELPLPG